MRVLVLGGEGMLGHKVYQVCAQRFDTYATFRDYEGLWRTFPMYKNNDKTIGGIDVNDSYKLIQVFKVIRPEVVINCIGIIKQLKEANDAIISININSLFPHRLAELCQFSGTRMIHISTDCVFSGKKGNYKETNISDAEDLYGKSKYLGEVSGKGCLTLRTSIIGRDFLKNVAFLEWFLSNRGGKVKGFKNSIYTGVTTFTMATIMCDIIEGFPELYGLYHISSEVISKYELLLKIRDKMKLDIAIEPFDDERCDRSLDCSKFRNETGYRIPSWDEMLTKLAEDKTPYDEWKQQYATA